MLREFIQLTSSICLKFSTTTLPPLFYAIAHTWVPICMSQTTENDYLTCELPESRISNYQSDESVADFETQVQGHLINDHLYTGPLDPVTGQ